jgi:hypothetical protein
MKYPPGHPTLHRADAAGTFVGILIVAGIVVAPLVWHLALVLPVLLWGR